MRRLSAGVCTMLLALPAARAHAAGLDEFGSAVKRRPAEQLVEAACELAIDLRGALATVEVRQRILNPGPEAIGAILELDLPRGAEVTGFAVGGDAAVAVKADAQSERVEDAAVLGADPAWLERLPDRDGYRVVLQPIAVDAVVNLTTRYVAVADVIGGQLRLTLPGRPTAGAGPNAKPVGLTPCRASIRATPGPGATVRAIHAGTAATAGRNATFTLDDTAVPIGVELDVAGTTPLVWTQVQGVAPGWSAALITVLGPRIKATTPQRVVFVVDGSRSMDLVGRHHVTQVIERIGAALPPASEVEAIVYDRAATRVLGAWQPVTPKSIGAIRDAISSRAAGNGSDLVGAFTAAKPLVDSGRGQTMLVVITDGVTDEESTGATGLALARALGAKASTVDVHTIVLDPASTTSPGAAALRGPTNLYGGSFVELGVANLDAELASFEEWLRPAWLELAAGDVELPPEVRAGGGFTRLVIRPAKTLAHLVLTGHAEAPFRAKPRAAPAAPAGALAALAMARTTAAVFLPRDMPTQAEVERSTAHFAAAKAAYPIAGADVAFAALTTQGRVAKARRKVVVAGGKYERMLATRDPIDDEAPASAAPPVTASAIAKETLARLFREQLQPKAFACYQRALGRDQKLAGTVRFQLKLGRGEVSSVTLVGLGEAQLDACLLDAAYVLTPPLPDFAVNADDLTIANYPLTFQRRENKPIVILGDADSESPLDMQAIQDGAKPRGPITPGDTSTPLGELRPTK